MRHVLHRSLERALVLIVFLLLCFCNESGPTGSTTEPEGAPTTLTDLRLDSDDIASWSEVDSEYVTFTATELYDFINGGAMPYEICGLDTGFNQMFLSGDERSMKCLVGDFVEETQADSIFATQSRSYFQVFTLKEYSDTAVFGSSNLSGATIIAVFGQFYFEMQFSGYSDTDLLTDDAVLFIEAWRKKVIQ